MVTDLLEIRRRSDEMAEENLQFRRQLKARHHPEGPFRILAGEIEKQIDCTQCANCCREYYVSLMDGEIETLADYLKMSADEVRRLYTAVDPDDSTKLIIKHVNGGCSFLDGNVCMVYDARPQPCRGYPYLSSNVRSVGNRMSSMIRRAAFCPIAFNAIEAYKKLLGFNS